MKNRFILLALALAIQCFALSAHASDLKDIFTLEQKFRRTQTKSPIYLQWGPLSCDNDSQDDLGFQIHVFKTKEKIGFVQVEISEKKESVLLRMKNLQDKTQTTEILTTLNGIFKVHQKKLPLGIQYLCHVCGYNEGDLVDSSHKAGFKQRISTFTLHEVYLEKKIPPYTAPLEKKEIKTHDNSARSLAKTNFPKTPNNPLSDLLPIFDPVESCSLFTGQTPFVVGQKYCYREDNSIYFEYAHNIDLEAVMEFSTLHSGFKIFRKTEKDEIGYIVPNYLPELAEIRIGAVWIKENMRRRGYCVSAMQSLMSLCLSKKQDFSLAKHFTFYTTSDNKAMLRIAQILNFHQKPLEMFDAFMQFSFNSIFFMKKI